MTAAAKPNITNFEQSKAAPNSRDAEEAVLGSILINPAHFAAVSPYLKTQTFFILRNAWIWEVMQRINDRHEPIEYLTVIEELRTQGRLDDIGGAAYITYLASNIGTSVHAETYARIVERAYIRRQMMEAAGEINKLAQAEDQDVIEVYKKASDKFNNVMPTRLLTTGMRTLGDAYSEFYDIVTQNDGLPHIKTGFTDLDAIIGGFFNTDFYVIAGRPGMGKTSLMLNMSTNAANAGYNVALYSLEMATQQVVARIVSTETGINSSKFRRGGLTQAELDMLAEPLTKFSEMSLVIDDTPAIDTAMLRASLSRLKAVEMVDIAFIDYLQLMGGSGENRLQVVSTIARELKSIAKEIGIPIVAGAQLSRAVETREDRRPMLSDLRESGEIENNADGVLMLYRDDYYDEASERPNEADVIVAKSRNDSTGTATLFFRKHLTQFANLARVSGSLNGEDE